MKYALLLLLIVGCSTITIPDQPKYREMVVFQNRDMVCFPQEGLDALQYNIRAQRDYADQLRKILEELKKKEW